MTSRAPCAQPFPANAGWSRECKVKGILGKSRRGLRSTSGIVAASSASTVLDELMTVVKEDNRGIQSSKREQIESIIDKLSEASKNSKTNNNNNNNNNTEDSKLSARWKLLWTSEKETLFLLETFKGSTAYQTINVKEKTLGNTVEFSGGNTFLVESEITIENETKVEFTFTSAGLKFSNGFMLPVPPVGKGWFDNVYVGDRYRVARDSRGDTLIVERC
tara:strand:+ start:828 stop:1484 length:657 start_codon:yes stop_codon:yes gene_type:complete